MRCVQALSALADVTRNNPLRLASLPASHPLHSHVRWCARHYVLRHRTPLHELYDAFPDAFDVEPINPCPTRLTWTPRFSKAIAINKDEACKAAGRTRTDGVVVYTDGSGYKSGVGAAAIAMVRGLEKRRFHLGTGDAHTVFEAEVTGTILALDIARATPRYQSLTVLLDNQAAIQALASNRPQPGQYPIREFASLISC